ncbi:MAG: SMI1/KNR4 family protein [Candidatus Bruticola sp.]
MNDQLVGLIKKYESKGDFTHALVSEWQLEEAEQKLGVKLPAQYVDFLKQYGHGGIAGIEVMGVGINGNLLFVNETLKYRKDGLAANLVVIENCDEWLYCIDCNTGNVISWSDGDCEYSYSCFDDFILDRFADAIENL